MTFAKVRGLADAIHGRVILYRWTLPSGEEREIIISPLSVEMAPWDHGYTKPARFDPFLS